MAVSSRCRIGLLSSTTCERAGDLGENEPRAEELLSHVEWFAKEYISGLTCFFAVRFYQLIPLGGVLTCRLVPEGIAGTTL